VDLIHLAPPFNSAEAYNVRFRAPKDLAARDKHQCRWWAVSLFDTAPHSGRKKKGADRGINGIRWGRAGPREGNPNRIIVSGNGGGNVAVRDARDLAGTVQRKSALGGVLTTLAAPTREMPREVASHGDTWSSRSS